MKEIFVRVNNRCKVLSMDILQFSFAAFSKDPIVLGVELGCLLVVAISPGLLKSGHGLVELLLVLLDVLLDDLVNIGLGPEGGLEFFVLVGHIRDVLVLHAGNPVEMIHIKYSSDVLDIVGIVIGVQSLDGGIHNIELDIVGRDAGCDSLLVFGALHKVHIE